MSDEQQIKHTVQPITEETARLVLKILDVYAPDTFDLEMAATVASVAINNPTPAPDTLRKVAELKPCPFCGTAPNFTSVTDLTDNFDHGFSIWCGECGIEMTDEYRDEVANRWNARAALSSTEGTADA